MWMTRSKNNVNQGIMNTKIRGKIPEEKIKESVGLIRK